jgi:photosystem II stability/assembly factor-like uncharacterized protein
MEAKMRISKITIFVILFIGIVHILNAQVAEVFPVHYRDNGPTLNDVCCLDLTPTSDQVSFIAVGNQGWIYRLINRGLDVLDSLQIGNGEYDLTGVSLGSSTTGWAVGYKRESTATGPKWQGAIWKSTDRGQTWTQQFNITGLPPSIPIPFLRVYATSSSIAWISCGNGYVLRTTDGGDVWRRTSAKPGGSSHYGWLWGIYAISSTTALVCSDQSGLISYTRNGGQTWTNYYHFPQDTFSYRDIHRI